MAAFFKISISILSFAFSRRSCSRSSALAQRRLTNRFKLEFPSQFPARRVFHRTPPQVNIALIEVSIKRGYLQNKQKLTSSPMRVLLDECVPQGLRAELPGHEVKTVAEAGWAGAKNGTLLQLAATQFDVLLTVDRNLEYQQSFLGLTIAV